MKTSGLKTDCALFPLDRPCEPHKRRGIKCSACRLYEKTSPLVGRAKKILIIKLGAVGDVLRTTFLLEGLKQKYSRPRVSWLVGPSSEEVLRGNPDIAEIITADSSAPAKLASERYAVSVNLDLDPASCAYASMVQSDEKIGFRLDGERRIVCSNGAASGWLEMSAFDDIKKANKKTYQRWMSDIVGLPRADYKIRVVVPPSSGAKAAAFARRHRLGKKNIVGINPGAGGRWQLKRWTLSGYVRLAKMFLAENCDVILYGGRADAPAVRRIARAVPGAISAGTDHAIPDFFALLGLCDVLVTGDTLAMHAALGLGKKVVAIFGPTSSSEIETYGLGKKVVSPAECVSCYLTACRKKPTCMEMIKPREIFAAAASFLGTPAASKK